jgi:hypothetical protein
MEALQTGTLMVNSTDDPNRRYRAIHRSTRPSPNIRAGSGGAVKASSLTLGEGVALTVYPRYFLRVFPWLAEGVVYAINETGVTLTRTIHGFGKPFVAGYFIPTVYFEEGRVFKHDY